jgi:hypothetical protein
MVIDHIQEEVIGSYFFKVWVKSLHCVIPLGEFKGRAGTVFFVMQPGVLPTGQI